MYSRINFTESPASGTGNVSKPKLMSQAWRMREEVRTQVSVFLHSEHWRCLYSFVYIVAGITYLGYEDRTVCENHVEGCHTK